MFHIILLQRYNDFVLIDLPYMKHIMLGCGTFLKFIKQKNGNIYFMANISRCSIKGLFDVCITVAFLHPFLPVLYSSLTL